MVSAVTVSLPGKLVSEKNYIFSLLICYDDINYIAAIMMIACISWIVSMLNVYMFIYYHLFS